MISADTQTDYGFPTAIEYTVDQLAASANINFDQLRRVRKRRDREADTTATDMLFQQAAAQGQSVFVSSGIPAPRSAT